MQVLNSEKLNFVKSLKFVSNTQYDLKIDTIHTPSPDIGLTVPKQQLTHSIKTLVHLPSGVPLEDINALTPPQQE